MDLFYEQRVWYSYFFLEQWTYTVQLGKKLQEIEKI